MENWRYVFEGQRLTPDCIATDDDDDYDDGDYYYYYYYYYYYIIIKYAAYQQVQGLMEDTYVRLINCRLHLF